MVPLPLYRWIKNCTNNDENLHLLKVPPGLTSGSPVSFLEKDEEQVVLSCFRASCFKPARTRGILAQWSTYSHHTTTKILPGLLLRIRFYPCYCIFAYSTQVLLIFRILLCKTPPLRHMVNHTVIIIN